MWMDDEMTALERLKKLEDESNSAIEDFSVIAYWKEDVKFLFKAFRVMRNCFIKSLEDEHGGDCSKWADDTFEERMNEKQT